ncbi:hypothetical protein vBYenM636_26 [Yersinia phage vB_YenM_636]|nr:hypothetical protein vBYenM12_26 [Yersinia phage vB_YenM_12]QKN86368.1 hypothetical protein vBYenM22_26 [Yersinia phage vB_YenM_22]QKN86459.1 hypothetical protein vBYenM25_26 [Yersinia phage vB_YenM_25]QKN86550.1 hypothetical protein vBYenM27_26 [Yersinia phage vB_YenM_27]QKN86641.1 hypothetical protein vBYenM39_26 [Yersinia phage vB_YenM_39]QKN86732.1 hypothetical protein vBYenM126_26 [Yersinia phage vB_YenM_126]QKN86823.1 hypothetical protein vBYenM526-1_26 [Yersinia phage vB_YenM_526-1]
MLHWSEIKQIEKESNMSKLEQDLRRIVEKHAGEGASIETIQFLINKRVKVEKMIQEVLPKPTKKSDKQAQSFIGGMVVGALVASYIFSIFLV